MGDARHQGPVDAIEAFAIEPDGVADLAKLPCAGKPVVDREPIAPPARQLRMIDDGKHRDGGAGIDSPFMMVV